MKIRSYDRSGDLLQGYFFAIQVPFDTECELRDSVDATKWIVSDTNASIYCDDVWAKVSVRSESRHDCPSNKAHTTGSKITAVSRADVYGGSHVSEFVRDAFGESVVANGLFAEQLSGAGLRGLGAMHVPIRENHSRWENPRLARLDFQGRDCARPMQVRVPDPNECPKCHWGPVVCPACLDITFHCPECRTALVGCGESATECPFSVEAVEETNSVIEGSRWDGSDFISGGYISRRALRHLVDVRASPFIAKLCWVNIERMTTAEVALLRGM